jgi:hypothetical protein
MKKIATLIAALVVATASAQAQGTLTFNNRIVGVVDIKIFNTDGVTGLDGTGYSVELYAGAAGSLESALSATGITSTFRTGAAAGYFTSLGDVQVPNRPTGSIAALQLRAWDNQGGTLTTYAEAFAAGALTGVSNVFDSADPLGGPGTPPLTAATLAGLQSFSLVPEPSIVVLGLLGGGCLLFLRRRKA